MLRVVVLLLTLQACCYNIEETKTVHNNVAASQALLEKVQVLQTPKTFDKVIRRLSV